MVVWKNGQAGVDAKVYTRPVAGDFALGVTNNLSGPFVDHVAPAVACNLHGRPEFFVVWQVGFTSAVYGVVGGFVDAGGDHDADVEA